MKAPKAGSRFAVADGTVYVVEDVFTDEGDFFLVTFVPEADADDMQALSGQECNNDEFELFCERERVRWL
jgi:hypothetical protein